MTKRQDRDAIYVKRQFGAVLIAGVWISSWRRRSGRCCSS
jgi:hypothetical protein